MSQINKNLLNLSKNYLFATIDEKVRALKKQDPNADVVSLGTGDIALPLTSEIALGLMKGTEEMTQKPYGYGPSAGYQFLKEAIWDDEYKEYGISPEEIFISDGINSSICHISELFSKEAKVGILDPTYPLYFDMNVLDGRSSIVKIPCVEENHFLPEPPSEKLDIVYLCSPSNPTGAAMTYPLLKRWVDWAKENQTILLFDAAYAAFITSDDVPKSIYEIPDSKQVAIEFRSFSKTSGFSGLRLGYTIVPKEIVLLEGLHKHPIHPLFALRQEIKTNGISYPIQKAGLYALSPKGKAECKAQIQTYQRAALTLREVLEEMGVNCYGGKNAPYLWCKLQNNSSWEAFDKMLNSYHLVTIPGEGFGPLGEGFLRLSCFLSPSTLEKTLNRFKTVEASYAL